MSNAAPCDRRPCDHPEPEVLRPLRPKQEVFARAYVELLGDPSGAFRLAYDTSKMAAHSVRTEANRLLKHPGIAKRIAELRIAVEEHLVADLARLRVPPPRQPQISSPFTSDAGPEPIT